MQLVPNNNNNKSILQSSKSIDFHQMRVGPGSYDIGSSMGQQVSSLKRTASAPSFGVGQRSDISTGRELNRKESFNRIKVVEPNFEDKMEKEFTTSNLNSIRRQQFYDINLNTSSSRFSKDKESSPGPGAYELPSTMNSSSPVSTIKSIRSPTFGPR